MTINVWYEYIKACAYHIINSNFWRRWDVSLIFSGINIRLRIPIERIDISSSIICVKEFIDRKACDIKNTCAFAESSQYFSMIYCLSCKCNKTRGFNPYITLTVLQRTRNHRNAEKTSIEICLLNRRKEDTFMRFVQL